MPNETKPNMGNTSTPPTETSAGPQPGKSKRPVVLVMAKNCAVGGKPIKEGAKLTVGEDINEADAKALLKMGRAELEEGDKKMNMLDVQIIAMAAAAQVTANGNGDAIDIRDFYSHAQITLNSSAGGGADHTLDVKLQESDDGSTGWADIAGAAFTQVTNAAAAFETLTLDLDKRKRYIRPVDTVAGTSPEFSRGISLAGLKQYS